MPLKEGNILVHHSDKKSVFVYRSDLMDVGTVELDGLASLWKKQFSMTLNLPT
jgi:hypothetical protein